MSSYTTLRRIYHRVIPQSVRTFIFFRSPEPVDRVRQKLILYLQSIAPHDDVYDAEYYDKIVEPTMQLSAVIMAESILLDLKPKSVVDIGCGTGSLILALKQAGVSCRGYDYAQAAIVRCKQKGLDVSQLDIESAPIPADRADLVISTEVAEHLPEKCADRFVEILTTISTRSILLTAAVPGGRGGTDHVNEQPNEYWIAKILTRGFDYDRILTAKIRTTWRQRGAAHCFEATAMIFHRIGGACEGMAGARDLTARTSDDLKARTVS